MDKQTESRKQFEAEFKRRHCDISASRMNTLLKIHNFGTDEDPDMDYYSLRARDAWEWWQKGRESLVVEIDTYTEFEIEHIASPEKEGYSLGWIDGRNYAARQVRAIGIRIKGEGDGQ
jgi:hypothetical protein